MENYINQLRDERVRKTIKHNEEKKEEDNLAGSHAQMRRQTAEWRVLEEYRRRRSQAWFQCFQASKFDTRNCFQAWMEYTAKKKRFQKVTRRGLSDITARAITVTVTESPSKLKKGKSKEGNVAALTAPRTFGRHLAPRPDSPSPFHSPAASMVTDVSFNNPRGMNDDPGTDPVGSWLFTQASGKELLGHLTLLESLYETRVASAERLLAAFIIFHRAVRPLSRLWGLSFNMDRSESRLRVASTPAPIAFVEELPAKLQPKSTGPLPREGSNLMQADDAFVGSPATPGTGTVNSI